MQARSKQVASTAQEAPLKRARVGSSPEPPQLPDAPDAAEAALAGAAGPQWTRVLRERVGRDSGGSLRVEMQCELEALEEAPPADAPPEERGWPVYARLTNGVVVGADVVVQAAGVEHSDCPTCHGTGQVRRVTNTILGQMQTSSTCPDCHGTGQRITRKPSGTDELGMKREEAIVTLDIPAGVEDGMQLSVRGEGNGAPMGGVPGDLIVLVEVLSHEKFQRNGKNLHHDHYISFVDAALGSTAEVPLLGGKAKIKVDAGTQSGKIVRLRGKGLPAVDSYGNGDLLINLNVWTPKKLSKDETKALEDLRESANFQPEPDHGERGFFDKVRDMFS